MVWDLNPELYQLFGGVSIWYYSLLFATGLMLGYVWVKRQYIRESLSVEHIDKLAMYIFVGTMLGARLGHCLFYEPDYYLSRPLEMLLPFRWSGAGIEFVGYSGLASHGGAIAVLLAIVFFSWKTAAALLPILDKVGVAIPLTGAFIRMGNFMNSEILGRPTNSVFGVVFSRVDMVARHPAQLYEAVAYLLLFVLLTQVYHRTRTTKRPGFVFGLFLTLLFSIRILVEFVKIDQVGFEAGMLGNMGQWLSVPFVLIGLVLMARGMTREGSGKPVPKPRDAIAKQGDSRARV